MRQPDIILSYLLPESLLLPTQAVMHARSSGVNSAGSSVGRRVECAEKVGTLVSTADGDQLGVQRCIGQCGQVAVVHARLGRQARDERGLGRAVDEAVLTAAAQSAVGEPVVAVCGGAARKAEDLGKRHHSVVGLATHGLALVGAVAVVQLAVKNRVIAHSTGRVDPLLVDDAVRLVEGTVVVHLQQHVAGFGLLVHPLDVSDGTRGDLHLTATEGERSGLVEGHAGRNGVVHAKLLDGNGQGREGTLSGKLCLTK